MTRLVDHLTLLLLLLCAVPAWGQEQLEKDIIKTSAGDLTITFIGHGSLMFSFGGKTVYVDPYSKLADYSKLPKADLVLVTHEHGDHLDTDALNAVYTAETTVLMTELAIKKFAPATVMKNGDVKTIGSIKVEAVPAYNLVHKRDTGEPFHPKGNGNGYVITFGDKRVYVAGDTENIPEMKDLKNIDIAFLPMNLPYTMTPEMVADAAKMIHPKVLYPYHTGDTDIAKLLALMKKQKGIEVRVRKMQ